jgi:hypothetical protein
MRHFRDHWRGYVQFAVFIGAELVLFGAAEGPQKLHFMLYGTVANCMTAAAFKWL